ncbi:hypothetical protein [Pseudonocardia zijingensis]|jgi:hypothetical protein|uniref:DUF2795 domain-containing protein n=1 Tax=Pseudonocardia zijingensis TaxID=153376 RepID=A0ABP4ACN4_9PSEU
MARFSVASRASFRSEHVHVSARISFSVTVRALAGALDRDDRLVAELSGYTSHAELVDLAATLDRYPDEDTAEIREILGDRPRAVTG